MGLNVSSVVSSVDESTARGACVLLMGHGTRDEAGAREFLDIVAAVRAADSRWPVLAGFLEFGGGVVPSISEAVDACVQASSLHVAGVPVLLHHAGHDKRDMPGVVDEACRRHPSLDLRLAPSIGFDHRLIEILQQRIADAQGGAPALAVEDVTVLLVGRGSTDREANRVFHSVGEVLSREVAFRGVRCCFVSLAEPDVVAGIQACVATGARRVLVMPYFVHSGILVTRIGEQSTVARARFPETEIVVGRPFGAHPHLVALIWERARSTLWSLSDSTPNEPMANSARAST